MKQIASLFFFLFCCPLIATAADNSLYYILDASGSMWGRVDGKIKIQVAKEVMGSLVEKTPEAIQAGLSVYGHRKKGDCADIEELLSLGPIDKSLAKKKIRALSPKGKTPLSKSIELAVGKVKSQEGASTIVLVSDGIETCDNDPCALTKKLKETGVNFVLHVVGFDVRGGAKDELSCIAKEGGGKYFSAKNADSLLESLNTIQKSVVEKKPIVEEKPAPPPVAAVDPEPEPELSDRKTQVVSTKSKSIRIKAKGPGRVKPVHYSWLKPPHAWRLIDPETGELKAEFKGSLDTQSVSPGLYQVAWQQTHFGGTSVILGEVIEVESRKTTELSLKTALDPKLPSWVKDPHWWGLREPGQEKMEIWFANAKPQVVPPGSYQLEWRQRQFNCETAALSQVEIEPDTLNSVDLTTGIHLVRADWVSEKVHGWGLQSLEDEEKWAVWCKGDYEPQLAPVGRWRVVAKRYQFNSSHSELGEIEIKAGQLNEFPLNTGVKLIKNPEMKVPHLIEFVELDQNGKAIRTVTQKSSLDPVLLKPGTYQLNYQQTRFGSKKATLIESFELPAGSLVEVEL